MGFYLLHDSSCIDHGFNSRAPTTQAIFCLLFLYGWSLFKDTDTADLMLTLYSWAPNITRVQSIISKIFLVFPPYCLGSGLVHLMRNELMADFGRTIDTNLYSNPFQMNMVGDRLIAMTVIGFVALLITYVLDLGIRWPNIFYKVSIRTIEYIDNFH